ncbi:MAG: ABC transporter permease subunit [Candidatus Cloacimonetes bacterium]|nr:ABC transporter permease subunit [Candidatus Cloacimonadota bacterium]
MSILKLNKYNILGGSFVVLLFVILALSLNINASDLKNVEFSFDVLFKDILISLLRVSITSVTAWVMGILGGYILFHSIIMNKIFLPSINFIRHISPFAWLPFAIIWFGLGELPIAFIMIITLFFPAIIATSNSFSSVPHEYIDEAKVCGASNFQLLKYIELPLTFISFLNLFRILWGLGWTMIIAAEMLGVNSGLGFRLLDFRYLVRYTEMLIYLIVMGTIGIIIDYLLQVVIDIFEQKIE